MNENGIEDSPSIGDRDSRFALSVIKAALALPGARVDRARFLKKELSPHCDDSKVNVAIKLNPAHAGITVDRIDKIANSVIRFNIWRAAGGSLVAGIPGGLLGWLALPVDTYQFVLHAIVLAQKLAYLYGWPDLAQEDDPDEETEFRMLLFMASMLGMAEASTVLAAASKAFAHEVGIRLPKKALTKIAGFKLLRKILKWFGVSLTKQAFAKGASKIIPIVSGFVGAGVTYGALRPMANNLKTHLRVLEYAQSPIDLPSLDDNP